MPFTLYKSTLFTSDSLKKNANGYFVLSEERRRTKTRVNSLSKEIIGSEGRKNQTRQS